jgi:Neurotransmitter-gated ion-channel ligand binding domain
MSKRKRVPFLARGNRRRRLYFASPNDKRTTFWRVIQRNGTLSGPAACGEGGGALSLSHLRQWPRNKLVITAPLMPISGLIRPALNLNSSQLTSSGHTHAINFSAQRPNISLRWQKKSGAFFYDRVKNVYCGRFAVCLCLYVCFLMSFIYGRASVFCPIAGYCSEDEERLVRDLFRGYNKLIRPVQNMTQKVDVRFGLAFVQLINVVSAARVQMFATATTTLLN